MNPNTDPVCDYKPQSNTPCADCPRKISCLHRCGLLQEAAEETEDEPALWQPEPSTDHCLNLTDPEGWWRVFIKWDGCFELDHFHNYPLTDPVYDDPESEHNDWDRMHICDIDDMIERLTALKEMAEKHFSTL